MKIIIINRWNDKFTQYHHYIDHEENKIAYITTPEGTHWLSKNSKIIIQTDLNNFDDLLCNVKKLSDVIGGVDLIIAMAESDLINAAALREIFNLPGMRVPETERVKDKVSMKDCIKEHGILTPLYFDCKNKDAIQKLIELKGFPLILKPKREAGSRGLHFIKAIDELNEVLPTIDLNKYECEEFIGGEIYHCDGIVSGGKIFFIKNWKYLASCMAFRYGDPAGSVMIDDDSLNKRLTEHTKKILAALEIFDGVFHLELIEDAQSNLYFLEIGARVGGGETNVVTYDLFGVDFAGCWAKIFLNQPLPILKEIDHIYGGVLLIPEPREVPCIVTEVTSFMGRVPHLYHETLPDIGEILDGKGGYDHISGKFLFQGKNTAEIEVSMREIMEKFRIKVKKVEMTL